MERDDRSCDLCPWADRPWYRTILLGARKFYVCIDCYVKMIEAILDALVPDEHKRGRLILGEYNKALKLNERLEWDFERPSLIDCGRPPANELQPEHPQGLITMEES